jgi:hypothetical protein
LNTSLAIRLEQQGEYFGEKIIEFFALHRIGMCLAISACFKIIFLAASPQLAPSGFFVFLAPWTFVLKIPFARPAI